MVYGAIGGAISPMIPQFIGGWTNPAVFGALGYLMKKPAFFTIAGYEVGRKLGSSMFGGGTVGNGNLFGGD